jgi:hypothetical protein
LVGIFGGSHAWDISSSSVTNKRKEDAKMWDLFIFYFSIF